MIYTCFAERTPFVYNITYSEYTYGVCVPWLELRVHGKAILFLPQWSGPHCINTMMRTVSCETQKLLNKKTIFIMRKRPS